MARYALGLDFGTNSVRALVVNVAGGDEIATAVAGYPSGKDGVVIDKKDPNLARQVPADWRAGLAKCVGAALEKAKGKKGFKPKRIIGIGVDTTGSTPLPVDEKCQPLADQARFKKNPNAYAWLWKDHTSFAEAADITALAAKEHPEYLAKCGGTYSSEWFWSKALHCIRVDPDVMEAAASWVEMADYIPGFLVGCDAPADLKRSVCAAGHKAMYHASWRLPAADMLDKLDPALGRLRREETFEQALPSDQVAGQLCPTWAKRLGLEPGIPVAVGAFDAHMGAVGAGIAPGTLVKIIGTSTCDMMVHPNTQPLKDVPGVCGIVDGSIIPGCFGLEAGQSAVGDIFNWFVQQFAGGKAAAHKKLTKEAAKLEPGESGLLALDWNNGNRTVLVDVRLTGLLLGQTLHTTPAEVYRALIEATAFGARVIIERVEEYGLKVNDVINCGGIAEKNPLLMQIYADVTGRPMKISRSAQTCALGAAMFGAVVAGKDAGGYDKIEDAQAAMAGLKPTVYQPDPDAQKTYDRMYKLYRQLHDAFGTRLWQGNMHNVMKEMLVIRDEARGG
ncbi:MAG: ribulokinase [Phycisphaerae bacterium]|nr:ribulokinase [Phycisphaerae bacterium]